jgi:hypothetical protein
VKFLVSISTPENAGNLEWAGSIPVSRTATVTPAPVECEPVAPTACTPQLTSGISRPPVAGVPSGLLGGRMRCVGIGGAIPITWGSR